MGNNTCKYTCWCVLYFNDFVFFPYILLSDTFLYSFTLFIITKINLSEDRLMVFEVNILIKVIDIDHLELWETHCKSFSNKRTEKYLTFDIHITLCYYFLKICFMWNWHTFPRLPSPILTLCRSKKNIYQNFFFLKIVYCLTEIVKDNLKSLPHEPIYSAGVTWLNENVCMSICKIITKHIFWAFFSQFE